jgi:hypothetical protein
MMVGLFADPPQARAATSGASSRQSRASRRGSDRAQLSYAIYLMVRPVTGVAGAVPPGITFAPLTFLEPDGYAL